MIQAIQVAGIMMSILLALFAWQQIFRRKRAFNHAHTNDVATQIFRSHLGMVVTDGNQIILTVNKAFTDITGYTAEEVIGKTPKILSSGQHDGSFYAGMWEKIQRTGEWDGEIWDRRKNGEIYPQHLSITAVKDANSQIVNYVGTIKNMNVDTEDTDQFYKLAFKDHLTGLPNRRLLSDRMKRALVSCNRKGGHGALILIDLDKFKTLNDALGHDIGDLLLQQVAQRLESTVREGDTVARLGGDEFVVVLEDLSENSLEAAAQTEAVGAKILGDLNRPYMLGAYEWQCSPSIGVALFNTYHQNIDELMKRADLALYQAKNEGRNSLRFYDLEMQKAIDIRAALEMELREAVGNDQFVLYYQAQVDSAGYIIGAEALIRWDHPERGLISPVHFIPLAEAKGLMCPIGKWLLEKACAQLKLWQQNELTRNLVLCVNIGSKQLFQPDFAENLVAMIHRHGISPKLLKLEFTEEVLQGNIDHIFEIMYSLKRVGVLFSLDDFGTGFSSLKRLKQLPFDQLKIDLSFIRNVVDNSTDKAIVRTIIAMAHGLGLDVIAEGVETDDQRRLLLKKGCTKYQGYFFGKPVPIEKFWVFVMLFSQHRAESDDLG